MPSISSVDDVDAKKYWSLVRLVVQDIFGGAHTSRMDRLKKLIHESPPEEQLLFYHTEPLQLAAELSGKTPTDDQIAKYIALRDKEFPLPGKRIKKQLH